MPPVMTCAENAESAANKKRACYRYKDRLDRPIPFEPSGRRHRGGQGGKCDPDRKGDRQIEDGGELARVRFVDEKIPNQPRNSENHR